MANKNLVKHLNTYLSDLHVMYTKLHNFHWNVEGKSFYQLHATLEGLYDNVAEELDAVAERILMIGERPLAKMADYLENSKIKEVESKSIKGDEIAKSVLKDFEYIMQTLKEGIEIAEENDDPVTADMLTGSLAQYEKSAWMLRAYLAE